MHGNLWEWCSDAVGRGGGWFDQPSQLRSAFWGSNDPGFRDHAHLGFRMLLEPAE